MKNEDSFKSIVLISEGCKLTECESNSLEKILGEEVPKPEKFPWENKWAYNLGIRELGDDLKEFAEDNNLTYREFKLPKSNFGDYRSGEEFNGPFGD